MWTSLRGDERVPETVVTKQTLSSLRDARRATRFPTKLDAILRIGQRRVSVVIADISRTGAMICGEEMPKQGERVTLCAKGLEANATVMWADEGSCGVNFHDLVEPLAVVRENLSEFAWLKRRRNEPGKIGDLAGK
jgi:hypothetical protein